MHIKRVSTSLDGILGYIRLISEIGEKAAGTPEELKAARLIEREFKEIGLENVHLEPFPVVCRRYRDCKLEMIEPSVKTIPCVNGGTSVSTSDQGVIAELVDAGLGTIKDYEGLTEAGVDLHGKIALIERSDRLTYWPDVACRLASDLGIIAAIFTNFASEHTAFRKEAFPFAPIPVVSIPYKVAQQLRGTMLKNRVKVGLKNIVEMEENGVSCNVIGDMAGFEYPEEVVILSAHHDSWFEGGNDNASGVALMLETAKLLKEKCRPKRTLRFISFGAEESGSNDFFEWAVGSFQHINKLEREPKNIVANVNLDVPAYGDTVAVRLTPEMTTYVKEIIRKFDLENIFSVLDQPSSGTDQWAFVMAGVPSVNFGSGWVGYGKIYHTNYDVPINVSYILLPHVTKVLLALVEGLGSAEALPFDFLPTIDRLERDLAAREYALKKLVDVSKAREEAKRFRDIVQRCHKFKPFPRAGSDVDVKVFNELQLEICSRLNRNMIGTGGEANKEAAWIIPERLDMLVKVTDAVKALQKKDLRRAIAALSSLRTMAWGLNVNLSTYHETFELMLKHNRYPGIYINVMSELLSLKAKLEKGEDDASKELSSIEEKYERIAGEVNERISRLNVAIKESNKNLVQIT